jgi:hypothetical protein
MARFGRSYRVTRDPYWLAARFRGTCDKCGGNVQAGDRIWYYPTARRVYCRECGLPEAAVFYATRFDETAYCGG